MPEGIEPLSKKTASSRQTTYRFTKRDGLVRKVEAINGYGELTTQHSRIPFIGGVTQTDNKKECVWEYRYDDNRHMIGETAENKFGDPVYNFKRSDDPTMMGVYVFDYITVSQGKDIGSLGLPAFRAGASRVRFTRTDEGWDKKVEYLDRDNKPQPNPDDDTYGYEVEKFDPRGLPLIITYLDADGKPKRNRDGYAKFRAKYDFDDPEIKKPLGNIIDWEYLDEEGKPVRINGYAKLRAIYDEWGNRKEVHYLDEEGKHTKHEYGNAILKMEYDKHGNVKEESYLDKYGDLITITGGYAKITKEYRNLGKMKVIETTYLNEKDQPVRINGYAKTKAIYDEWGNGEEVHYLDGEGKSTKHTDGNAIWKMEYDKHGNVKEESYLDKYGDLITITGGYAKITKEYDDEGKKLLEVVYLNEKNEPVLNEAGYAIEKRKYDKDSGKITEDAFFGPDGKQLMINQKVGYAKWIATYRDGKLTEEAFFGSDGQLMIHEKYGYARSTMVYDDRGNSIEGAFFGPDNKLMVHKDFGCAKVKKKYNDQGKLIEDAYFGPDNKLMINQKVGYAKITWTYDEHGNSKKNYFGIDGPPLQTKVTIMEVSDGQGYQIGLQQDDIIVSYDGKEVTDVQTFISWIQIKGDKSRELKILRDGKVLSFQVAPREIGIRIEDRVVTKPKETNTQTTEKPSR